MRIEENWNDSNQQLHTLLAGYFFLTILFDLSHRGWLSSSVAKLGDVVFLFSIGRPFLCVDKLTIYTYITFCHILGMPLLGVFVFPVF